MDGAYTYDAFSHIEKKQQQQQLQQWKTTSTAVFTEMCLTKIDARTQSEIDAFCCVLKWLRTPLAQTHSNSQSIFISIFK